MASTQGRHLLAVFSDQASAESAADRLSARGVDRNDIHIGREEDMTAALRTEMRAELEDSWASPQAGFIVSKEAAKAGSVSILVLTVIGAVLGIVLAFLFPFGLSLWVRLLGYAAVGATAGATVGFLIGSTTGQVGSQKPLAGERGVTLRIDGATPEAEQVLRDARPIRLDVIADDGTPTGTTLTTEEEHSDEGVAEQMARGFKEPDRERPSE